MNEPFSRRIVVTMLGAGSAFTESLMKDLALMPGNQGGEIRLIDIDGRRLALAKSLVEQTVGLLGADWTVKASAERAGLLPGSDYLINCVEVAGLDCVRHDYDIPMKYGVDQCIGDTVGPGGLMKGLRTIPVWLDILRDAERLCPNALVLNYTNPMAMLCIAAVRTCSMRVVGLCHSVQGTSRLLARHAEVEYDAMDWECAGINHLAWFTRLEHEGKNLYPRLMAKARDEASEFYEGNPIRCDMMLHFGAFITESSGHLSEYLPYYRKRKDLLEKYARSGYRGESGFYANNWPTWRKNADERRQRVMNGEETPNLERSEEYASGIIQAIETGKPFAFHGNVPNDGLIENLSPRCCVEVKCEANGDGWTPVPFGQLPPLMAAICESNARFQELAAEAAVERSFEMARHALMLDPLTAAVCSPAEISAMADELFSAQREHLAGYR
ncbi:MAG: alpha-glucosidase/alpha-galactosidase [Armatimonadetes bacterium]|nr:alpha-glucosidase/alpha-galactosidase [Armatimonadota bacterium]